MNEEAPFETNDEGECQHRDAGYSSQVVPAGETLLKVQFGHDTAPVIWASELYAVISDWRFNQIGRF
jgi:hypothetical protein